MPRLLAVLVVSCVLLVPLDAAAALVGKWTFEPPSPLADATGNFPDLVLQGSASISGGRLHVAGTGTTATGWAATDSLSGSYVGPPITNQTLVSWLVLDGLCDTACAGSALTLDSVAVDQFHGIVFGELEPDRWFAGSEGGFRSQPFAPGFQETTTGALVQVALTYSWWEDGIEPGQYWVEIVGYRNGQEIGRYQLLAGFPVTWWPNDTEVFFGVRHGVPAWGYYPGALNATIEEARIYDEVLTAEQLRGLRSSSRLDLEPAQWRQIGLPLVPGAGADTVADLFADDLTGVYGTDWRVYDWDESSQQYAGNDYLPDSTSLEQGEGYWVKHLAAEPAPFLAMDGAMRVDSFFDVFLEVPAGGGWNMVGHPFAHTVDWADVVVYYDGAEHTLAEAEAAGKMSRVMFKWNGAAYSAYNGLTPGAMGTLAPWDGFWVEALAAGVRLRVYPTPSGGDRSAEQPPRGWFVRLVASSGAFVDDGNVLGMVEGARAGLDENDLPEMAPFADDYLTVVFPHPEWRSGAGDYTTDFRALTVRPGQRELRWPFEVRSGVERTVTLRWQGPARVLARSEVLDPLSGARHRVSDHPDGITFDLKEPRQLVWVVRGAGLAAGAAGE